MRLQKTDALIIVDVQRDFLPGGTLAVAGGDSIIPTINCYAEEFDRLGMPIFATRDWHPNDHCSFQEQGGPWPRHCIAGSRGAGPPPSFVLPGGAHIVEKATTREADAYSGFQGTDLAARLRARGCQRVFVCGLATDYCVRATAIDALNEGFEVVVLKDAVRPVDVHPGDGERALAELVAQGARLISIDAVAR